ncbi:MAG: peptidoglycan DD-metalloendopeptidase family protein [Patescibacteria group bacterium]|nr:peptidoglycan DD-metalloendopeptidase family protein [Patescibacteria group bacterium]
MRSEKERRHSIFQYLLDFVVAFFSYVLLRVRQFFVYLWALNLWIVISFSVLKDRLVRKMFWGRSTFYRSAFQFSVGIVTFVITIGGLAGRLNLFITNASQILEFPTEHLGDADYVEENASMLAIVASSSESGAYAVQKYVVQKGDTLESIANEYEISKETIMWANGIKDESFLKIGQTLTILPINAVLHTVKSGDTLESIAEKYGANVADIFDINWLDSKILKEGQELLVPNGKMPQPKPVVITPIAMTVPLPPPPLSGTVTGGTGSFVRPCGCGYITRGYSAYHQGVDIAQAGGCTIVAVDGGVVTQARWYGNGGLQIMIDHGNGWVSLYAHNATIYVKEGQKVSKGQAISYMGATGHAYGVHLHFGLQLNGYWVNPQSYIAI